MVKDKERVKAMEEKVYLEQEVRIRIYLEEQEDDISENYLEYIVNVSPIDLVWMYVNIAEAARTEMKVEQVWLTSLSDGLDVCVQASRDPALVDAFKQRMDRYFGKGKG